MMVIENPQNVLLTCFVPIFMTFIYDLKNDLITLELHCVIYFL